jgi:hypothetical protein
MEDRREIETSNTWPPTTAMVGSDSQRVGKSLPPPWSPRAVQARWMRFIIPIRLSMDAILLLTCLPSSPVFQYGRDYSVVSVWGRTKKRSQGRLTGRARFEETESAGKKENLPAKEAKPFQGRRRLPISRRGHGGALNSPRGEARLGPTLFGQPPKMTQPQPRLQNNTPISTKLKFVLGF